MKTIRNKAKEITEKKRNKKLQKIEIKDLTHRLIITKEEFIMQKYKAEIIKNIKKTIRLK